MMRELLKEARRPLSRKECDELQRFLVQDMADRQAKIEAALKEMKE